MSGQGLNCDDNIATPVFRAGIVGGLLLEPDPTPIICGGKLIGTDEVSSTCIRAGGESEEPIAHMSIGRKFAASAVVNNGASLLIAGGADNTTDTSTEYISIGSLSRPGPDLPVYLERLCMVHLSNGTTVVIGGTIVGTFNSHGFFATSKATYSLDQGSSEWIAGPELLLPRMCLHHVE